MSRVPAVLPGQGNRLLQPGDRLPYDPEDDLVGDLALAADGLGLGLPQDGSERVAGPLVAALHGGGDAGLEFILQAHGCLLFASRAARPRTKSTRPRRPGRTGHRVPGPRRSGRRASRARNCPIPRRCPRGGRGSGPNFWKSDRAMWSVRSGTSVSLTEGADSRRSVKDTAPGPSTTEDRPLSHYPRRGAGPLPAVNQRVGRPRGGPDFKPARRAGRQAPPEQAPTRCCRPVPTTGEWPHLSPIPGAAP